MIAIDHLPTLLPREASDQFCHDLAPTLEQLMNRSESLVWKGAENVWNEKNKEALSATSS